MDKTEVQNITVHEPSAIRGDVSLGDNEVKV